MTVTEIRNYLDGLDITTLKEIAVEFFYNHPDLNVVSDQAQNLLQKKMPESEYIAFANAIFDCNTIEEFKKVA